MVDVELGIILAYLIGDGAGSTIVLDSAPAVLALAPAGVIAGAIVMRRFDPTQERAWQDTVGLSLFLFGIAMWAAAIYAHMAWALPLWELPGHRRALPALAVTGAGVGLILIGGFRLRFAYRRRHARERKESETSPPMFTTALADHSTGGIACQSVTSICHDAEAAHAQSPAHR